MDSVRAASLDSGAAENLQSKIEAGLRRARGLLSDETRAQTAQELESLLGEARQSPYEVEFRTHIELGMTLAEIYLGAGDLERAREVLNERAAFAEKIFQIMQATGDTDQKRAAAGGRTQIRDRARQVGLLGRPAPEINIKNWIVGEPATLASLRGKVVLLDFWATWCKPCREMFGKLKALDAEYRERGLEILALTRHYFAYRGTAESQEEELELMRTTVGEHDLGFRVGVAETEATQDVYGATGMPALCLIDRSGIVRYAHFGGGPDPGFREILSLCLDERV